MNKEFDGFHAPAIKIPFSQSFGQILTTIFLFLNSFALGFCVYQSYCAFSIRSILFLFFFFIASGSIPYLIFFGLCSSNSIYISGKPSKIKLCLPLLGSFLRLSSIALEATILKKFNVDVSLMSYFLIAFELISNFYVFIIVLVDEEKGSRMISLKPWILVEQSLAPSPYSMVYPQYVKDENVYYPQEQLNYSYQPETQYPQNPQYSNHTPPPYFQDYKMPPKI